MVKRGLVVSILLGLILLLTVNIGDILSVGEERVTVEEVVSEGLSKEDIKQKDVFIENFKDMGDIDLNHSMSSNTKKRFSVDYNVDEGDGKLKCDYYYKHGGHIKYCGNNIQEVLMTIEDSGEYETELKENKEGTVLNKGHKESEYGNTEYKGYNIEYKYVKLDSEKHLISVRIVEDKED